MTLSSGTRLGPYELIAPVGAGGMGEVYRAKDTRLDRTVAVKVLPAHLSSSGESRQRFEREAKMISQLSHPHICALYDVGNQDGVEFLVMEYLEGETLSERLLKSALPFEQVLRFGVEIADALDKAHRQGIVHRDLKPGNVMITRSGVKLLDFGLAKAILPEQSRAVSLSSLPTALTQEGTILGTFQHMAPEQLEGKEADARTDIFALGTVLYEMATGQKAFSGKTQASLIAAIIERVPPAISSISPMTPPAFDRVVKTCLAKDPEDRWQTAHDVMLELKWIAEGGSAAGLPAPVVARRRSRERIAWALLAVVSAMAIVAALAVIRFRRAASGVGTVRAFIPPPPKSSFQFLGVCGPVTVSPDGRRLAYVRTEAGQPVLFVRPLASLSEQALAGTVGASFPFWSPDSQWIGFFADDKLKKIPATGGPPVTLCAAPEGRGGSWSRDGTILFALRYSPIYRVDASGGSPAALTKFDVSRKDTTHRWPAWLPDGRRFLYLASPVGTAIEENAVFLSTLDAKQDRVLLPHISSNVLYASGYLLYVRDGNLMAHPFDAAQARFLGEPSPIVDGVSFDSVFSHAVFSASENGVLAYQAGPANPRIRLAWYDRQGKELAQALEESTGFGAGSLSPDGTRVAMPLLDRLNCDIWVLDLVRGTRTRLTFDPAIDRAPVWSPDGTRIAFLSERRGQPILLKSANGGGAEEMLLRTEEGAPAKTFVVPGGGTAGPSSWSSDGRFLLFSRDGAKTKSDVWVLPLFGDRKPFPLVRSDFSDRNGQFSPDGRWVAYVSDESGTLQVYVIDFPQAGGKWQISTNGGSLPRWRPDGKELFYMSASRELTAVEVKTGPSFEAGPSRALFSLPPISPLPGAAYSPTRDGRFLVAASDQSPSTPITLVLNWTAELAKR
jgi:eukaryotic-like serine/threonine-protein kinase